jgi:hypothetical protein
MGFRAKAEGRAIVAPQVRLSLGQSRRAVK